MHVYRMFVVQLEVKLTLKSETTNAYGAFTPLGFLDSYLSKHSYHCTLAGANDFDICTVSILALSFLLTSKKKIDGQTL